jgi:glucan phosphoethanolaminetransferase (alkaline phosphatase superfamily)
VKQPLSQRIVQLIHSHLGWLIVLLGVVNSALGWKFALSNAYNYGYVPGVIGFFIILIGAAGVMWFVRRVKGDMKEELNDSNYLTEQAAKIRQAQQEAYQMQNMRAESQGHGYPSQVQTAPGEYAYPSVAVPGRY